jgi:hypothetical protein
MGNTLGTDMGDTFSAARRLGTRTGRGSRTAAHFVANPVLWAFRGLRRSGQQFLFNIRDALARCRKCHPCLCSVCNPCVCPLPSLTLSPQAGRGKCLITRGGGAKMRPPDYPAQTTARVLHVNQAFFREGFLGDDAGPLVGQVFVAIQHLLGADERFLARDGCAEP